MVGDFEKRFSLTHAALSACVRQKGSLLSLRMLWPVLLFALLSLTVQGAHSSPIVLNCSSNITVVATNSSGATVFYSSSATGGCRVPSVSCSPPSGSKFPIGSTPVTCTASDTCGTTTNCGFNVTVTRIPIALTCSSNITVGATNSSGATVFYSSSATGGCSMPSVSCSPPSGSRFPIGSTPVTCTASDTCGTTTNCGFTVTVTRIPIALTCSSNITVTAADPSGATVFYSSSATGGGRGPSVSCSPPSGSKFPIGSTPVTCTASDTCGTTTNCGFTVTVARIPIALTCSSNITVVATNSSGATVFYSSSATGGGRVASVPLRPPRGT